VLQLQIYEAIAQRINLRYHLSPMDREETECYVAHHLKMAGAASSIFTDDALDMIFEFSGDIARKVNNICLACLLDTAIRQKLLIDDHMVKV
jgi:type II secretory pathway predicted ATPase ExeA